MKIDLELYVHLLQKEVKSLSLENENLRLRHELKGLQFEVERQTPKPVKKAGATSQDQGPSTEQTLAQATMFGVTDKDVEGYRPEFHAPKNLVSEP